jgi:hypothetical protein
LILRVRDLLAEVGEAVEEEAQEEEEAVVAIVEVEKTTS